MSQLAYELTELELKEDPRGVLVELARGLPAGAQVYLFTITPECTRGGHWHERKTEWFVCLQGEAILVLEPERGRGGRVEVRLTADLRRSVRVNAGVKHTFSSSAGATILTCVSESFDPSDPDTFFS